ncbi:MAG: FtsX-like permease family protein [Candidatus Thorarchaeota archaeon]
MSRLLSDAPQVLATLLIFSLSSGVLGGVLIYMDSAGPYVLTEMVDDAPIHMRVDFTDNFYKQDQVTSTDIIKIIESQDGIHNIEHLYILDAWFGDTLWTSYYKRYVYLGVGESFFDEYSNVIRLSEGTPDLTDNACYLEKSVFEEANINIGDSYSVSVVVDIPRWNEATLASREFTVLGTFETDLWGSTEIAEHMYPDLRVILTKDALQSQFSFVGIGASNGIFDKIWAKIDDGFLRYFDPSEAEENLQNVRKKIEQRTAPLAIISEYKALGVVRGYSTWQGGMTSIAIAFSIPTLVMGTILVHYSTKLLSDRLRRDVGMLRVRGASGRQSLWWVLSTTTFTGIVGGIGAILISSLAAVLSGSAKELFVFDSSTEFSIILQPSSVFAVFLFSFFIGFVTSTASTIRVLLMMPSKTHDEMEVETSGREYMTSPLVDVVIILFSGIVSVQLLLFLGQGMNVSWLLLGLVIMMIGVFVVFFTRFLSRFTGLIKCRLMDKLHHPQLRVGARVVGRTAKMKMSSEALGVMFIAMVFTAGTFSAIASSTGAMQIRNLRSFEIGAEIVADAQPFQDNFTLDMLDIIASIEGVEEASALLEVHATVHYYTVGPVNTVLHDRVITVYGVQPSKWTRTAFLMPYFTAELEPEDALENVEEEEGNVISSFKPVLGYNVAPDGMYSMIYGDYLEIDLQDGITENYLNLTIIDIMSEDADIQSTAYMPGFPDNRDFLIMNLELLHDQLNSTRVSRVYVDIEEGTNYTRVMDDIRSIAPYSFSLIRSSLQAIDEVFDSRGARTIHGVYTLNVLFSILYLTIGISIIAGDKYRQYGKQFAVMRAMGTDSITIQSAMLFDTLITIVLSSVIGVLTGLLLNSMVLGTPLMYMGVSETIAWNHLPISLSIPFLQLGVVFLTGYLFPMIATLVVTRRHLRNGIAGRLQVAG